MKTKQQIRIEKSLGIPLEEFLHDRYILKEKTIKEIADELFVGVGTIYNWLNYYDLKKFRSAWNKGLTKQQMKNIINKRKGIE